MNSKKIILLILLLSLVVPAAATKRSERHLSMTDLTQLNSPSYVPFPYPGTRYEVVEDLKYAIKQLFSNSQNPVEYSSQPANVDNFLPCLLTDPSTVVIKSVLKVKNKISEIPEDYSYLIVLYSKKTKNYARVAMSADGLFFGALFSSENLKVKGVETMEEIKGKIANRQGIEKDGIKSAELIAFDFNTDNLLSPLWVVKLSDGASIYVDYNDNYYKQVSEEKSGALSLKQTEKQVSNLVLPDKIIFDSIGDHYILLKRI